MGGCEFCSDNPNDMEMYPKMFRSKQEKTNGSNGQN